MKHNEKVCRAHDFGSFAQGQGRSQVKGQNLVSAPEGTSGGILKSHRPSIRPSVRPSVTNCVSAISHKLLKQI